MTASLRERGFLFGAAALALMILLSACGSASSSATQQASSPAPAPTQQPTDPPSAAGSGSGSAIGTQPIPGIGAVLADSDGLTLYHLTTDTSTKTTCTGGCAQVWPPLLATNGDTPSAPAGLGTFGTFKRPDGGEQVTFNGMLLYTYSGDSQPGQANGQGIGGTWFAVTS